MSRYVSKDSVKQANQLANLCKRWVGHVKRTPIEAAEAFRHRKRLHNISPRHKYAQIFYRYNLTTDEYQALYEKQGGKCFICGNTYSRLDSNFCIDHDHNTGKVRGLLCKACNWLLGWYEKNRKEITKYLKKASELNG